MKEKTKERAFGLAMATTFFLGVSYFLTVKWLGGSAISGGVEDGKYYLSGENGHILTSPTMFFFNLVHGIAMFVSIIVTIVLGKVAGIPHRK